MKRNSFFVFITYIFTCCWTLAQNPKLPSSCKVSCPEELMSTLVRRTVTEQIAANNGGTKPPKGKANYWAVYSDRDNNATHVSPSSGSDTFKKLRLNDELRIAEIQNGYAHVYYEPRKGIGYPQISSEAESKGWVPMTNLLLWRNCPTDEKDIYEKALVMVNLDNISKSKEELLAVYNAPSFNAKKRGIATNKIFYVMKQSGNFVLLSSEPSLGGRSDQVLEGWVAKGSYFKWNERSCIEPNWDKQTVEELKRKNVSAKFYDNSSFNGAVAGKWSYGMTPNIEDCNPATQHRMPQNSFRFPLLTNDTSNDNIFKCTVFANVEGSLNKAAENADIARKTLDEFQTRSENINLIVVIDGTRSMEQFYPAVKKAIKSGLTYFDKNQYKIRVGIVIYRDVADGKYVTEHLALKPIGSPLIEKFLDTGGEYGIKSSPKDKTNEEDLFKGLELALDTSVMDYDKDQSNLILLVGDCGNMPDEEEQKSIVDKLVANKIQLFTFQVNNPGGTAWNIFRSQTNFMMKNNLDRQYQLFTEGKINSPGKFTEVKDGRDYIANVSEKLQFYAGALRYPQKGILEPERLTHLMDEKIGEFANTINNQIAVLVDPSKFNIDGGQEAAMTAEYLKNRVGEDNYKLIKRTGATVAMTGYTKVGEDGVDYWKPVIFIESSEFTKLLDKLHPVYSVARDNGNDREAYINALVALAKVMVPDVDTSKLTQNEITRLISGLNAQTDAMRDKSYTLDEIKNTHAVSQVQYARLLRTFRERYENLKEIQNKYLYKMQFNGITHYWIPLEDLP